MRLFPGNDADRAMAAAGPEYTFEFRGSLAADVSLAAEGFSR